MIRFANVRTSTGRTNRPIARLYPLELTEDTVTSTPTDDQSEESPMETFTCRPTQEAAKRGRQVVKQWIASLRAPPGGCPKDMNI